MSRAASALRRAISRAPRAAPRARRLIPVAVADGLRLGRGLRERLAQVVEVGLEARALGVGGLALAGEALDLGGQLRARGVALARQTLDLDRALVGARRAACPRPRRSPRRAGPQRDDLPLAARELRAQPLDLAAQRAELGAQRLVDRSAAGAPAPAAALVGQRQVDDQAAADLAAPRR